MSKFSVHPFHGKRVRAESSRPYHDVLERLRELVPKAMPMDAFPGAMERAGGLNVANFERVVRSQVGESGFMLFQEIDHSEWLPLYGLERKAIRLILGNPMVAITMLRHDLEAGLFAPVELLLCDAKQGHGSTVIYDLPSSLMVIDQNPPLLEAARGLDAKLEALVRNATS